MNKKLKNTIENLLQEDISFTKDYIIETSSGKQYFVKSGVDSEAYRCEANGLKELSKSNSIQVAKVVSVGEDYILTEYVERGIPSKDFFTIFGKCFAHLHRYQAKYYGFYEDNFIGLNPQKNIPTDNEKTNWAAFYFNKRLLFQYKLAEKNGYATDRLKNGFRKLEATIESILQDSVETPCLLHGDLWAGNFICDRSDNPILIDPAVYYGHREADLAMTKLFGGFPQSFYDSYNAEYPLKTGWEHREGLYKLYHVLNHLNIFGQGYLHEAEQLLSRHK